MASSFQHRTMNDSFYSMRSSTNGDKEQRKRNLCLEILIGWAAATTHLIAQPTWFVFLIFICHQTNTKDIAGQPAAAASPNPVTRVSDMSGGRVEQTPSCHIYVLKVFDCGNRNGFLNQLVAHLSWFNLHLLLCISVNRQQTTDNSQQSTDSSYPIELYNSIMLPIACK